MPAKNHDGHPDLLLAAFGLLIIAAPLAFGCVHAWGAMGLVTALFLIAALRPEIFEAAGHLPKYFARSIAAVFIYLAIQTLLISAVPQVSHSALLLWAGLAAGFLFVLSLNVQRQTLLLQILALSGFLQSVWGMIQTLSGSESIWWFKKIEHVGFVTATYWNRNHLAGLLELCLGAQTGLLLAAQIRGKNVLFWLVIFSVTLFAFVLTGSRAGLASFLSALILTAIIFGRKFYRVAFGTAAIALMISMLAATVRSRWEFLHSHLPSGHGRFIFWGDTFRIIQDHLWTGTGLDTYRWLIPQYQSAASILGVAHAHNDYLELISELGVPAFAMLAAAFGLALAQAISAARKIEGPAMTLAGGAATGILAFALHGLADFNFAVPANMFLWLVLVAIVLTKAQPA